jgi:hypothetical protein
VNTGIDWAVRRRNADIRGKDVINAMLRAEKSRELGAKLTKSA